MILYQIVNLGFSPISSSKELGIDDARIEVVKELNIDKKLPVIYLYWGKSAETKNYEGSLNLQDLAVDNMIIPVIDETMDFKQTIPEELGRINALTVKSGNYAVVGNRILKHFGLYEATNKVFISYRRTDTSMLAHQLFERLIEAKYTPFLDCYSIESGVDFQEYLRNEIVDADVFVYLNSPHYNDSPYTTEERDCAQKLSIGIVQVIFNNAVKSIVLNAVDVETYEDADKDRIYPQQLLDKIIQEIERQRAVMYEFRRKSLIDSYTLNNENDALFINNSGIIHNATKHELLNPIVHVPTSVDYHKTDIILSWASPDKYKRCVLFDSQFVRRNILDHIKWLNNSLPICSVDIND